MSSVLALVLLEEPAGHVGHVVDVQRFGDAHRAGELEAKGDAIGGKHAPGSRGARDGDAEEPDGPAAEDRHRLAREIVLARREDRVAERLLERRDLGRELRSIVGPDHRLGHDDELGEGAVAVDAEDLRLLAHVRLARAAVEAHAARDVALGRDVVALRDAAHVAPDLGDGAGELVAQRQRRLNAVRGPVVPAEDVQVGPAETRGLDPNEDVVVPGHRNRRLVEDEPRTRCKLANRPHRLSHWASSMTTSSSGRRGVAFAAGP